MVEFFSEMTVKLIRHMGHDDSVIQAAQVSAKGENNPETVPERLIQALMKGRHGSPFEHNAFTFFVEAPLFVFREWQRHRMSSFNEMSGRYTTLPPKFYIPSEERKMWNAGTKMKPNFTHSTSVTESGMRDALKYNAKEAWEDYEAALADGIANEVARMVLPLNIYSQMYWTVNARSLMNFLSLRVESDDSLVRSYPQGEIDQCARQVEEWFANMMPKTYLAFVENGTGCAMTDQNIDKRMLRLVEKSEKHLEGISRSMTLIAKAAVDLAVSNERLSQTIEILGENERSKNKRNYEGITQQEFNRRLNESRRKEKEQRDNTP